MKLVNLVKGFNVNSLTGKLGSTIKSVVASSPLPTLMEPLNEFYSRLVTKLPGTDSLNIALSNIDSLYENAALNQADHVDRLLRVESNQVETILSGLSQSRDLLNTTSNVSSATVINIISGVGFQYTLQLNDALINSAQAAEGPLVSYMTNSGLIPMIEAINNEGVIRYVIHSEAYPRNYFKAIQSETGHTVVDHVQYIGDCLYAQTHVSYTNVSDTLRDICIALSLHPVNSNALAYASCLFEHFVGQPQQSWSLKTLVSALGHHLWREASLAFPVREHTESLLSVVKANIISAEINALLADVINAIKIGKISSFFSSVAEKFSSAYSGVKSAFGRMRDAYTTGGLKGLIYCIFGFMQVASSITDDDGVMQFTDNAALTPKEYIGGIISTVFSAIASVASAIAMAFSRVVSMVAGLIGGFLQAIGQSFNYDRNATKASVFVPTNDDDGVNVQMCAPVGFWQTTIDYKGTPLPQWYLNAYDAGESCLSLSVPGGELFIGPGSFDDNNKPTALRFEFHPSAVVYDRQYVIDNYGTSFIVHTSGGDQQISFPSGIYVGRLLYNFLPHTTPDGWRLSDFTNAVTQLYDDLNTNGSTFVMNGTDGVLTDADDVSQYCSVGLNLIIFTIWLCASVYDRSFFDQVYYDYKLVGITERGGSGTKWMDMISHVCLWFSGTRTPGVVWNHFPNIASYTSTGLDIAWQVNLPNTPSDPTNNLQVANSAYNICDRVMRDQHFIGIPKILPPSLDYAICLPKYNSATFWKWIALSIAVVTVVTVTAVIATVFAKKFAKSKRANNKAKFDDVQGGYEDAIAGYREEVDPDTGEVHRVKFDTTTPEGKAYISACYKDYKTQALKNNLWSHIVGGSRYDIGSFWGEAEDDSGEETGVDLDALVQESDLDVQESMANDVDTANVQPTEWDDLYNNLHVLIAGV